MAALDALLVDFAGHQVRVMLPGGAVFATDVAAGEGVALLAAFGRVELTEAQVPVAAAFIAADWTTVDELVTQCGVARAAVVEVVEAFASLDLVHLRKEPNGE